MIISKAIRYLAERLGIKTTGTGISDAIMDLADGFPFGVETKIVNTVVFEDSLPGNPSGSTTLGERSAFSWLTEGTVCKVTINDEVYENVIASAPDMFGRRHLNFGNYGTFYLMDDNNYWISGIEEDITYNLKIEKAEVQTVVTPIDIKYLPIDELKAALGLE